MSECAVCNGTGYVLRNHDRKECESCGGRGITSLIFPTPLTSEQQRKAKLEEERKQKLSDQIEEVEEQIEDKENEIDGLEEEIDCLNIELRKLKESYQNDC